MQRGGLSTMRFIVRLEDGEKRAWLGGLDYPEAQALRAAMKMGAGIRLDPYFDEETVFAPGSRCTIVAVPA